MDYRDDAVEAGPAGLCFESTSQLATLSLIMIRPLANIALLTLFTSANPTSDDPLSAKRYRFKEKNRSGSQISEISPQT